MQSEIHVVIIWEKAFFLQKDIIDYLKNNLDIISIFNCQVKNNFEEFLNFFYSKKVAKEELLLKESLEFICLIVKDKYSLQKTYKGLSYVNENLYKFKKSIEKK